VKTRWLLESHQAGLDSASGSTSSGLDRLRFHGGLNSAWVTSPSRNNISGYATAMNCRISWCTGLDELRNSHTVKRTEPWWQELCWPRN